MWIARKKTELLLRFIKSRFEEKSYVCLNDSEQVIGVFYFIQGKNIESTYKNISKGKWAGCDIYGVVHRVAGDGSEKGIGAFCIGWAFSKCGNLREAKKR